MFMTILVNNSHTDFRYDPQVVLGLGGIRQSDCNSVKSFFTLNPANVITNFLNNSERRDQECDRQTRTRKGHDHVVLHIQRTKNCKIKSALTEQARRTKHISRLLFLQFLVR